MDFPFPKSTTCTKTLDLKNGYLTYWYVVSVILSAKNGA